MFCSKCGKTWAVDEFEVNQKGNRNKTCKRHCQKRSMELEFDDWEDFVV